MAEIASFGVNVDQNTRLAQNAQDTADEANKKNSANSQQIANINDPNYLTPFEKPQLEIQMDNFAAIYKTDKDIAEAEGIDFTAYDAAYQAYLAYMKPLTADISTYSPIVRTTFNSLVTAVQNAKTAFDAATKAQYTQAMDKAKTDIANGQSSYAAMKQDVATMKTNANGVATIASAAISSAGFASDVASTASQAANDAKTVASQAANNVAIAKNDAANALTSATTAFNTANGAKDSAGTALDNAKSALNKVNGLQFGGRNLILNSANLSGFPTWVADGNKPTTTADGSEMTIVTKHGGLIINSANLSKNIPNIGDTVTISVEAKGTATLEFNYQNGNDFMGSQHFTVTDEYKRYFAQYTWNPINVSANQQFVIYTSDSTDTTLIIKNPKLEVGNVATDWTPAPEDVQVQISDINGELQKKVSQDTYDTLAGTVGQVSTLSKQNQSELVTKADSQAVDTLKQRVTTAENTLTQTATKTELEQTNTDVDKLNNTVKSSSSEITAQAGKIDGLLSTTSKLGDQYTNLSGQFKLSSKQLTTTMSKVDNIGGQRNYLINSKSYTLVPTGQANYDYRIYLSDDFWKNPDRIKPNNIKVSFNMRAKKALAAAFDSNVYFGASPWYGKPINYPAGTIDSKKYELTYSITDLAYTTDNLFIRFQAKDTADFPFVIENAVLSIGSNFPDWSPAPEDQATVTALTQVKQTVEGIKTDISKKIEKTDLNGYATQDWAQNQINITADGINSNLSSVKTTVDGQTTNINDLKSDSSSFKSQFTTVNDTLGKHTTDISTLQTDSSGFKTQFQTVNDNVGKNATDIGTLQASSKELTTGFNTLTTDNGTNKNDISQLKQTSKEVNSTLETVQTQVQNSAVGTNLLTGTNNAQDYTVSGSGWALGSQSSNGTNASIPCTPGVSYTYSAIVKSTTYDCYPELQFFDSSKKFIKDSVNFPSKDIGVRKITAVAPENAAFVGAHMVLRNPSDSQTVVFNSEKLEKGSLATDWCANPADNATVTALTQVKQTAEGASQLSKDNQGNILALQSTAKGLQTSVSNAATKDQLTILSSQLTNKITDLKSSTNSQFTQTASDMDLLVKKGDVVNQFNIDAGGALLQTVGGNTKIVLSAPNVIVDSANPMQIQNANIVGTLTGKTFEAGTITATTKIISSDIEASLIHSKDNSFSLNGATGDIVGPSIHAADNSWGISNAGKIHGTSITASVMDISGDGKGPNFDAVNVTPDTTQGIYSRYKYSVNSGYDVSKFGRTLYKNGYLVINGDTFLNRTIGDWSADGGGKYVYDTMYEAHTIKMRAYNYTGSNVQTDDPSSTEGSISSRLDIQPSAITMGRDWSVGNPNILIDGDGLLKVGSIAINGNHSMGTTDGSDMYFMKMNKNATDVSGTSIPIHAARYYTANMGISGGHVINSYDGGDVYLEDKWGSGGNTVSLHVKKLYNSSLLSLKTDITTIDPNDALETIANTDFRSYRFKTDDPSEPKSVSPILDDENQIPKYNTPDIFKSADGKSRNDGNILGYTALSVQALYAKIKDLTARLQKLEGAN